MRALGEPGVGGVMGTEGHEEDLSVDFKSGGSQGRGLSREGSSLTQVSVGFLWFL